MTARRVGILAAYWAGLLAATLLASLAGVLASALIAFIGLACAPDITTKETRRG